ncbi:MAG: hypothetical protein K940chlam9_00387 [Chlamydiae bacterium]|nr:hypothetical protein [Chlamydiota bacterium]
MSKIGTYVYTYGAGSAPNRKICFERESGQTGSFCAKVYAYSNGEKKQIGMLSDSDILVEGASTSDKLKAIAEYRNNHCKPNLLPSRVISEFGVDEQDNVLSNLTPKGSWRVTIQNHVGDDPRFEKVVRLTLFDAS